jgi:hypothetical protein
MPAVITQDQLVGTNITMLVLTSLFVLLRVTLQVWKRKPIELPDFFIYFAYALYVTVWACYFYVTPPIFRAYAVIEGSAEPYATMGKDLAIVIRIISSVQLCFYTLLLAVKLSLLTFYRKLLIGLPGLYGRIWWGIVAFCVLVRTSVQV